eukprot:3039081-Pleurochrysis_carterae.AAC.1
MRPSTASGGHEWALVHIVPIKDVEVRQKATPMPLRRRCHRGARGEDPMCPCDALCAMWAGRVVQVPTSERTFGKPSATPLFETAEGAPWTSTESRSLARLMAAALGLDAADFGG